MQANSMTGFELTGSLQSTLYNRGEKKHLKMHKLRQMGYTSLHCSTRTVILGQNGYKGETGITKDNLI